MKKGVLLKVVLVLCLVGFLTSLYLLENHYAGTATGSVCDFSETVSCSLVNSSEYSELFNVPVAIFGGLWFVVLALLAWKSFKRNDLIPLMLGWNIFGMLFVFYLIWAEWVLAAICPFCTLVHIITLITLIIAVILYRKEGKKFNFKKLVKIAKPWVGLIILINVIPLIAFNISIGPKEDYTNVAKCITDSGVNMYGSFKCGVCAKTRAMFDDSFEYINEIECHPQGKNSEWELCQEKGIEGTPTWILEPKGVEEKRSTGFMSIQELREFSGCTEDFGVTNES